jgi:ribonuclease D
MSADEPRYIEDDAALRELIDALSTEPIYGLDTEFVAERSYWPRLCLLQLSWPDGVALVDALAVDVTPLHELLEGPGTMVTHAGGSDLPILERACGARPSVLFDTQVVAGFVGLGLPSLVSLVSSVLGTRLDKGEQLTDWSRRPLSHGARLYAAGDVAHLLDLTSELQKRLVAMGRADWAAAECEVLRRLPVRDADPDTAWWRIKGSRSLRGEKATIAQSVAAWRERRAQELDRPPRFVLSELILAGLTARPPRTASDLADLRGAGSLPKDVTGEVLEAVAVGRSMDASKLRVPPKHDDDALDAAVALLAAWTAQVAVSEKIDPRLLGTRDDVRSLVNGRPSRLAVGWRAEMVGERILDLVGGRAVLRLVDGGRRVQLEPSPQDAEGG